MINANAMNPVTDRTGSAAMTDIFDSGRVALARLSLCATLALVLAPTVGHAQAPAGSPAATRAIDEPIAIR